MEQQDRQAVEFLRRHGLIAPGAEAVFTPLAGGVGSDIWTVEAGGAPFVVKRALAQLRVAEVWEAPVSRNASEVAWLRAVAGIAPGAVPAVLAADEAAGLFAMSYLAPETHPVWKRELRAGRADPAFAAALGALLARIHAATADKADYAARFATDAAFDAIRVSPYLGAAAARHPDLAPQLLAIGADVLAHRRVLVHGDVSPKNILCGPRGPVILDAECAWFGEPAFDLVFCLNHLLLKCVWTPAAAADFLRCFASLAAAYLDSVSWEEPAALEARAARLLPALTLARIDGKSPVEYITAAADKARVRRLARRFLASPAARLADIAETWNGERTA